VVSWWGHVNWRIMWGYAAGGLIATRADGFVAFVPSKAMVYLILGTIPFLIELLPRDHHPNIEWRGVPLLSGLATDRNPARCRQWRLVARCVLSKELA